MHWMGDIGAVQIRETLGPKGPCLAQGDYNAGSSRNKRDLMELCCPTRVPKVVGGEILWVEECLWEEEWL